MENQVETTVVETAKDAKEFAHSEKIDLISKALSAFQAECPVVEKDKNNPFLKSKYADLGNILRTINPVLGKHGLAVTQMPIGDQGDLITLLAHSSGQWIRSCYRMRPTKNDAQSVGSALTYQKRYAVAAILGVPIDDESDDDGEGGSVKPVNKQTELQSKLGTILRTGEMKTHNAVLAAAGLCKAADLKNKDEAYLRKAFEALGGEEKLATIKG